MQKIVTNGAGDVLAFFDGQTFADGDVQLSAHSITKPSNVYFADVIYAIGLLRGFLDLLPDIGLGTIKDTSKDRDARFPNDA